MKKKGKKSGADDPIDKVSLETLIEMYKTELSTNSYSPKDANEKAALKIVRKEIAYAKRRGYAIDLPYI